MELQRNRNPGSEASRDPHRHYRWGASALLVVLLGWMGWRLLVGQPADQEASLQPTLAALSTELAMARSEPDRDPVGSPTIAASALAATQDAPGWVIYTTEVASDPGIWAMPAGRPGEPFRLTPQGVSAADPAVSPDGETLAYRSHQDGQWDLYLRVLATGETRRLTDTPGYEGAPTWSPDGRWIAYEAFNGDDLDIWILSIEPGRTPIQLTNEPGMDRQPTWDPSGGRRIAFVSNRDGSPDIFLANLDRPNDRFLNLTKSPDWAEAGPTFSPSGERLAYSTSADGLDLIWTQELDSDQPPQQLGVGTSPTWLASGGALAALQRSPHSVDVIVYDLGAGLPPVRLRGGSSGLQLAWSGHAGPLTAEPGRRQPAEVSPDGTQNGPFGGIGRMGLIALDNVEAPNARLVEAASQPFRDLRSAVEEQAGWDFLASLDEAFVGLNDPLPPGFAYNDWLYTGRAFSFQQATYPAGWVEVVPEPLGGQMYWRVYVKAARQDGTLGEPLPALPWDFDARYRGDPSDYDQGGRPRSNAPGGYYVDFTALAESFGFLRQPALTNWRTFYPGARFNEFAFTEGLDWEAAMLQLYPLEAIVTPTPFSSPTPTPTNTPWPTVTPWWWQWRTPTYTPSPSSVPPMTPSP